jgi:hypothetical protein
MRRRTTRVRFGSAVKWAGIVACIPIAGLWVFTVVAVTLPDDRTSFHIPLWVPLLAAVILRVRWHLPRRAEKAEHRA